MGEAMRCDLAGVILAAGKGGRMYPFSTRLPKPLLPVCNKPLLQLHIETMAALGIRDIYVVIGHYGFEIVKALGMGEAWGVRLHYVDQGEPKGIAHAVGQLEPCVERPFLMFLGDIYFRTADLRAMVALHATGTVNAVLATKCESDPAAIRRNFAVIENDEGFVRRVIEKPRHLVNTLKGCGLYLFDLHIFDAIRRTPRTAMRDEYELTDSVQILIDDGFAVKSLPVVEEDINLTYPSDLLTLNLAAMRAQGLDRVVARGARVHPGAQVVQSVIGEGAEILCPITVRESVLLAGAKVTTDKDIVRTIVAGEQFISCGVTGAEAGG